MKSSYRLIVAVVASPLLADGLTLRGDPVPLAEDRICKPGGEFPFHLTQFNESGFVHSELLETVNEPEEWKKTLHDSRMFELRNLRPKPDLYYYGDGNTESWRFSGRHLTGKDVERHAKGWDIFWAHNMGRYSGEVSNAALMGVGTDTSSDLIWRLRNGEGPAVDQAKPRAYVINIGMHDLLKLGECKYIMPKNEQNHAQCPRDLTKADAESVFLSMKEVLKELWKQCQAPVVLNAIMPAFQAWPKGPFGEAVPHLNMLLKDLALSSPLDQWGKPLLQVVDCDWAMTGGAQFTNIDRGLSFDYLHFLPKGMMKWAECTKPAIDHALWGVKAHDSKK